jgi:nucleotide-binding universal stress UspA family protein
MYHNILVPLDGSDVAECSLPHARAIASAFRVHKVFLIRVLTPLSSRVLSRVPAKTLDFVVQSSEADAREYLSKTAVALKKEGMNAESVVVTGKPAEQIVDFAKRNGIDLIVMATHGRSGVSHRPYGSVADGIIRASSVPILLVVPRA